MSDDKSKTSMTWLESEYGLKLSVPNISDRYDLYDEIGKGGAGQVYIGYDQDLSRQVAIKVLHSHRRASKDAVIRFLNEPRVTARLQHPGIVPIHDIGLIKGELFFSMEKVEGKTLRDVFNARGGTPRSPGRTDDLVRLFEQICHIVAYAHDRGVVHRDLKPDNIMVGEFNKVYVMDWGLAFDLHQGTSESDINLETMTDLDVDTQRLQPLPGTPRYMAPEQILGMQHLDHRCDVYALGLILYEILAGVHPYEGETPREIMHGIKSEDTPPIMTGVSRDLKLVCMKALEKLPGDRYANAADLAEDVHRALNLYPVSVDRRSLSAHLIKAGRRHWLLGIAIFAVAFGAMIWAYETHRDRLEVDQWVNLAQQRLAAAERQEETIASLQARVDRADIQWRPRLERNLNTIRARQRGDYLSARLLLTLAVNSQGANVPQETRMTLFSLWLEEISHELSVGNLGPARRVYLDHEMSELVTDPKIFPLGPSERQRLGAIEALLKQK